MNSFLASAQQQKHDIQGYLLQIAAYCKPVLSDLSREPQSYKTGGLYVQVDLIYNALLVDICNHNLLRLWLLLVVAKTSLILYCSVELSCSVVLH